MSLSYELKAHIIPTEGSRGDRIKLTAKFSNASQPVVKAYGTVRMYGFFVPLTKESDDTFVYSGIVPYEAPSGRYDITVYGKSEDGSNGPEATVSFVIR